MAAPPAFDDLVKVMLVGAREVGKTSFMYRYGVSAGPARCRTRADCGSCFLAPPSPTHRPSPQGNEDHMEPYARIGVEFVRCGGGWGL